jgi:hypothetical protein
MRIKQFYATNGLILAGLTLYYFIINVLDVTFTQFFFVLGVVVLIQSVFGFLKGKDTRSLIPIFERVSIYEKEKMGSEWFKQRRSSHIWNLFLSAFMFLQAYWNQGSSNVFKIDFLYMIILTVSILIIVNISFIIHIRKVDSSISEHDMKGYTWKSNLIGMVIGAVLGVAMFVITIYYVISGI